jgi:hypothetical protein
LDPNHIAFRPKARDAIKAVFTQVLDEIPDLTVEEKKAFAEVIALLSNFEELLAHLFTGYFTNHIPDQKNISTYQGSTGHTSDTRKKALAINAISLSIKPCRIAA